MKSTAVVSPAPRAPSKGDSSESQELQLLPQCLDEYQELFSGDLWNVTLGAQESRRKMLQTSNYSLVLSLQFLLLSYDLFVNSFSELLRMAPVIQLVLFMGLYHSIQDIAVLFNIIIIFLMFFNTFVFQAGLVNLLFHKFKGTITLTAVYFALSISLHVWVMNLRWKNSNRFVWTDGLQTLFVFQRLVAVLYCYFYKRTAVRLGDPRFYQDSLWLRKEFMQVRSSAPFPFLPPPVFRTEGSVALPLGSFSLSLVQKELPAPVVLTITPQRFRFYTQGKRLSSTPLEILFFLNGWYYATYFLLELFIFLYKGLLLPYPTANLVLDVVMLFLYLGIEVIRLFFGTKGNLCQRKMPLGISVALAFPSAMMASYYLLLQTYVLRLEAIMNGILLFFCGSELLLEVLTMAAFSRYFCLGIISCHLKNQFPSDLKFFSLIIVARASYVDCVGALGFWQDLSHALPVCAVPRVSHTSTPRLRTMHAEVASITPWVLQDPVAASSFSSNHITVRML
ncbi:hypothetical protein CB1_000089007 [Camelus ferus]|nr:hypothetical protein CB1_000089007 [Camelus ferus]